MGVRFRRRWGLGLEDDGGFGLDSDGVRFRRRWG